MPYTRRGRKRSNRQTRRKEAIKSSPRIHRSLPAHRPTQSGGAGTIWAPYPEIQIITLCGTTAPKCPSTPGIPSDTNKLLLRGDKRGVDGNPETASFFQPQQVVTDSAGNIFVFDLGTYSVRMVMSPSYASTYINSPVGTAYTAKPYTLQSLIHNDASYRAGNNGANGYVTTNDWANGGSDSSFITQGIVVNPVNDVIFMMDPGRTRIATLTNTNGRSFSGKDVPGYNGSLAISNNSSYGTYGIVDGEGDFNSGSGGRWGLGTWSTGWDGGPTVLAINPTGTLIMFREASESSTSTKSWLRMMDISQWPKFYLSTLISFTNNTFVSSGTWDTSGNFFYTMATLYVNDGTNHYYKNYNFPYRQHKHAVWKMTIPPGTKAPNSADANGNFVGDDYIAGPYGSWSGGSIIKKGLFEKTPLPSFNGVQLTQPVIIAGSQESEFYGDDAVGTNAYFRSPRGLTVDNKNNIYVADTGNNLIRLITPNSTYSVYTVAGNVGQQPSTNNTGDGSYTSALFANPVSIAYNSVDSGIIVLDNGIQQPGTSAQSAICNSFSRIRKIVIVPAPTAPTGLTLVTIDSITITLSWTAGSGIVTSNPTFSPTYYCDAATSASPTPVRIDVQAIPAGTSPTSVPNQYVSTNANGTRAGFYTANMFSVPVTPGTTYTSFRFYAANRTGGSPSNALTNVVVPPASKNYTILKAGTLGSYGFTNGSALSSKFQNPRGLAADENNNIYVADTNNHCIRKVDTTGTTTTFFGTPPTTGSTLTSLSSPKDVTFSNGGGWPIYVTDSGNNRVLSITSAGVATLFNKSGVALSGISFITVDTENNVYVTSEGQHCIYKITSAGVASVFAGISGTTGAVDGPAATATFYGPQGIHYGQKHNTLYIADCGNNILRRIVLTAPYAVSTLAGMTGAAGNQNGLGNSGRFNGPFGVTADLSGNVYVADFNNNCIRKVNPAGFVSVYSGTGTAGSADGNSHPTAYNVNTSTSSYSSPAGICNGASGMMFIAEQTNQCIRALSPYPPPVAPTSQRLTAVTTTSATIEWEGDSGATSYSFTVTPSSASIGIPTVAVGTRTATFTGLTESTAYSIKLILTNAAGSTFPPDVKCITQIDTTAITLNTPTVSSFPLIGTPSSLISASLSWTGLTRVPTITYSLTPSASTTATVVTGTMPANQRSPFAITGLQPNTTYAVKITGSIPNFPSVTSAPAGTHSATSNEVTLTTGAVSDLYIGTIAGISTTTPSQTTATATASVPTATQINTVRGITQDTAGNIYLASMTCILKLSPPATATPLYVFDATQQTPTPVPLIKKPAGLAGYTLSLFAGSPTTQGAPSWTTQVGSAIRFQNISAMIYSTTQQCLYVSDFAQAVVVKVTLSGTPTATVIAGTVSHGAGQDGMPGTNKISVPKGLAEGPDGTLFICDFNYGVRMLNMATTNLTTISPIGSDRPADIVAFPDGSLYYSSQYDHTIRKLTPNPASPGTYTNTIYAGASQPTWNSGAYVDGPLLTARFNGPQGLSIDSKYNMYVYDSNNLAIRLITGGNVYTLMGGRPPSAYSPGNADGIIANARVKGDPGSQASAIVYTDLFSDPDGNLYLSDFGNGTLRLITPFPASQVITQAQLDYYKTSGAQASSAVAQGVSSALAQSISGAQQSSAIAQVASQAVASSAIQQTALSGPVLGKDQVVAAFPPIKEALTTNAGILYSSSSTASDITAARSSLMTRMTDLQNWLNNLASAVTPIFVIAPLYQDRALQTVIPSPFLTSINCVKLYDAMRLNTVVINSSGYLISNPEVPSNRPFVSGRVPTPPSGATITLAPTDVALVGDLTLPQNSAWTSYFDTAARRYFYVNSGTGESSYEHPFPPVFSGSHTILSDITTKFLPAGWLKLQGTTPDLPYYLNTNSTQAVWAHPAPPPNPSTLTQSPDATLFPSYKKYISTTAPTTGKPFYVNTITQEAQWDFPDVAFNVGPSTAQKASSSLAQSISGARESSATAQGVSSALAQSISGARASSALMQSISGAQASSATAQVASSALAQKISGARESSATAQVASSALAQSISGARESSATAQGVSSALAQSISGAQASSAVAQRASSSLMQSISGAEASSALAQSISGARASSALAQSISGAQASSAVAQRASSSLMQSISGAQESSARAQDASSALAQKISGARESSATAQTVSSALAQSISGAQASSAVAQQASMAVWQEEVDILIANKDRIKNAMLTLQSNTVSIINSLYASSSSTAPSGADISTLQNNLQQFESMRANLINAGAAIFQLNASYQDRSLQTVIPDSTLSSISVTKVYDALRNAYLYLDRNQNIISNPITPAQRAYVSTTQRGGGKQGKSRKSMILFYDTSKHTK